MEVRFRAVENRAVSNRNCVTARWGGEQRNENDQSVTQVAQEGRRRELGFGRREWTSLLEKDEVCRGGKTPLATGRSRRGLLEGTPTESLDFALSLSDLYASIDSRAINRKSMPQLIVRQIEEKVVKKLKQQAGEHGVSMEEEHRRILRESLLGKAVRRTSFKEALLAMPDVGKDEDFQRGPQLERAVEL